MFLHRLTRDDDDGEQGVYHTFQAAGIFRLKCQLTVAADLDPDHFGAVVSIDSAVRRMELDMRRGIRRIGQGLRGVELGRFTDTVCRRSSGRCASGNTVFDQSTSVDPIRRRD
jgi:hypothetical protein